MGRIAIGLVLSVLAACPAWAGITHKVDKFSNENSWQTPLRHVKLEGGGSFLTGRTANFDFFAVSPTNPTIPKPYFLQFQLFTPEWVFVNDSQVSLQLKVDGQILALAANGPSSRTVLGAHNLLEMAIYPIDDEMLEKIAAAHDIEFRTLGDAQMITGTWPKDLMADAREFQKEVVPLVVVTPLGVPQSVRPAASVPAAGSAPNAAANCSNGGNSPVHLGVQYAPMPPGAAQKLSLPGGLVVVRVTANSAAANAGLMPGDVLITARGKALNAICDLQDVLGTMSPGAALPLHLWRAGKEQDLAVVF